MSTLKLPNGRSLEPGDEFTVDRKARYASHDTGRYRFIRVRDNGTEVDAWGPIDRGGNAPYGRTRSFNIEHIDRVHNKKKERP